MFATLSLRKKIGFGFATVLLLLVVLGVISYCGIKALDRNTSEVIQKNEVIGNLYQREIDHLNWASKVSELLVDDKAAELRVETDPHRCAFGKWYDSEARVLAEKQIPGLAQTLAKIDAPHKRLHATAVEIGNLYRRKDTIQAGRIYAETTLPALADVKGLIDECCRLARNNVNAANEKLLRSASNTRWALSLVTMAALVFGSGLAFFIARGIARAMQRVIERLKRGADETSDASRQVSSASQSLAQGASEQAASIEETSASIEEMSAMTKQNAANAVEARSLAGQAREYADTGTASMERMSQAIADIKKSSDETAKIIKTIDDIAFQTNLLALNAAVEAARAGEAGKGFAVVAEEVRTLAQRSAEAARSTADLIQQAVRNSDSGVAITQEVAGVLENIAVGNRKVNDLVSEIAAASEQQSQGIEQVNIAVSQMEQVTQNNAGNAEESASAAEELSSQAEGLKRTVQELRAFIDGGVAKEADDPTADSRYQHHRNTRRNRPARSQFKPAAQAPASAEEFLPFEDSKELAEF